MQYDSQYKIERLNMVRNQVRVVGVDDQDINDVMLKIPRHLFVAPKYEAVAYSDAELPLHQDGDIVERFIARPEMFARLISAADITQNDIVLDIGCGTGYSTAVIAELARSVVGIDYCQKMINRAEKIIKDLGMANVCFYAIDILNDLCANIINPNFFDVVIINGSIYHYENTINIQYHNHMINPLTVKLPQILSPCLKKNCEADRVTQNTSRIITVEGSNIHSPMHIVKYDSNMNRSEISEVYIPKFL
jgi:protein-L-isoaspartate(D-aspartate) O-methyltransferase